VLKPTHALVVEGSADEPVVLVGPPTGLTGRIRLHNPSRDKVVLRDAGLTDPSGVLRLPAPRHALAPVVLRPDQGGNVPLSIAVDATTPPGEYRAELDVGGGPRPVILRVTEAFDLKVLPNSLVLANLPGVSQTKRIIITNTGNVAFTIADPGVVDLRDDMPHGQVVRIAIEPSRARETPDLEALVAALLEAREETAPVGRLDVRILGGRVVDLQPGETEAVELEITLQGELPRHHRYRGQLPVLTRDVDVIVVASGGPVQEKAVAPPRRRAPAAKRSPRKGGGTA
jgi:hypothetical protein